MSLEGLKWAMDQNVGDAGAKFVLVALGNLANPINSCDRQTVAIIPEDLKPHMSDLLFAWPSQEYLARVCEMGERTVRRHINTLEERDRILSVERRRIDGRRSADGYLLITSPANLAGTYEDTQGLIQEGITAPPDLLLNKLPLPLFRVRDHLSPADWIKVARAAVGQNGEKLSTAYMCDQFDEWVAKRELQPRHALNLFLDFIAQHIERNKL